VKKLSITPGAGKKTEHIPIARPYVRSEINTTTRDMRRRSIRRGRFPGGSPLGILNKRGKKKQRGEKNRLIASATPTNGEK